MECAGESDVEIQDSVRGKNVYIVQSSGRDTNNHLMGLLLFIQVQPTSAALLSTHHHTTPVQACKLAGARRITAVLPLLPYARGDHKLPDRRKPIAAKAGDINTAGRARSLDIIGFLVVVHCGGFTIAPCRLLMLLAVAAADSWYAGGCGGPAGHHSGHPLPPDRGLLLHPGGLPHRPLPV